MSASIVDLGACTAVGLSPEQTAYGIRAGLVCPRTVGYRDENGEPLGAALVTSIPEEIVGWERLVSLALPALRQAMGGEGGAPIAALYLTLPAPRPGLDEADARQACKEIAEAALPPGTALLPFFGGNDAFGRALAAATARIANERRTQVVVGAVDSWHEPRTYQHMDAEFRFLSDRSPDGFIPGEASAFARLAGSEAGDEETLATVESALVGAEDEANDLDATWTDLVSDASAGLGAPPPWILVDQRTERHRARSWGRVQHRLQDTLPPSATVVDALAERLGDVGAASGAVLLVHASVALAAGFAPGSTALVALGSDGPGRACFALRAPRAKSSPTP